MTFDFQKRKEVCLKKNDFSRKGSIDASIWNLVKFLNDCEPYFTTSSCSGRLVLLSESLTSHVGGNQIVKKKGCKWFFVSHQSVDVKEFSKALQTVTEESKLKFEPFIIHVQCASLADADNLLKIALASGFRNSGITLGKRGKHVMVAVRSTLCLEVPLTRSSGAWLTSDEYVHYIIEVGNAKLKENQKLIQSFEKHLRDTLSKRKVAVAVKANHFKNTATVNNSKCTNKQSREEDYEVVADIVSLFT